MNYKHDSQILNIIILDESTQIQIFRNVSVMKRDTQRIGVDEEDYLR